MKKLLIALFAVFALSSCSEKPLPNIEEVGGYFGVPFGASKKQARQILNAQGIDTSKKLAMRIEIAGVQGRLNLFFPFSKLQTITVYFENEDGQILNFLKEEFGSPIDSHTEGSLVWITEKQMISYAYKDSASFLVFTKR